MEPETIKAWTPILIALITMIGTAITGYFTYKANSRNTAAEKRLDSIESSVTKLEHSDSDQL